MTFGMQQVKLKNTDYKANEVIGSSRISVFQMFSFFSVGD